MRLLTFGLILFLLSPSPFSYAKKHHRKAHIVAAKSKALTPEQQQRQEYAKGCLEKLNLWEAQLIQLRRRLGKYHPDNPRYHSLRESLSIMHKNIDEARAELKRVKVTDSSDEWKKTHAFVEARFRRLDATFARAMAE